MAALQQTLPHLIIVHPYILFILPSKYPFGFPGSSAGKESTCNAGDSSSIPGSGRSAGERIGCPLQYSRAQTVKNPPAMWETWIRFLGWEDSLEKEMAIYLGLLAWKIPWTEEPGKLQSMGL